jgi:hypothetical protein
MNDPRKKRDGSNSDAQSNAELGALQRVATVLEVPIGDSLKGL